MNAPPPPDVSLTLDESVRDAVRVGTVSAAPIRVEPSSESLLDEIELVAGRLRDRYTGQTPAQIAGLRAARDLYKRFGVDPTKTRPSSEALLRRVLRNQPLPRIQNAVDLGNLVSLEILLPLGLYDVDKLQGPVVLRCGSAGERYAGIRKDDVHLEGRLVLADDEGPFGNPTSDSRRTSVDPSTERLWMVMFAPGSRSVAEMREHVARARALMESHLGERVSTRGQVIGDIGT